MQECLAIDITEQKRAETALRDLNRRLDEIIEYSPDATVVVDHTGTVIAWNKAMEKMTGVSKKEMLGKGNYEYAIPFYGERRPILVDLALLPEEEFARLKDHYDFIHWDCDTLFGEVYCSETYGGKGAYLWASASRLRDVEGKVFGAIESIRDITDRKLAEEKIDSYTLELKQKGAQLEQLYQQLDEEINKARMVHERILPSQLPDTEGLSFAAHYQPAQKMGGDFYDVIQKEGRIIFYLSDVSGHGLDGAMLSVFVKHTIKSYVAFTSVESIGPAGILCHLAEQFCQENYPEEFFVCVFMAVLDLDTMKLTYSGAGFQDKPLVYLGNGKKTTLSSRGLFISPNFPPELFSLQEQSIHLTPGTTIFLNTDGLTEQSNNGTYYIKRLPSVFYEHAHLAPQIIAQAVVDDFRAFNRGSLQGSDDITFLVLQVDSEEKKTHRLELTSDFKELSRLQEDVLKITGTGHADIFMTCLHEMAANAMEHGNRLDPQKTVSVEITLTDKYILASVEDQGQGFNWCDKIDRPLDLEGSRDRGRGIAMTRICADEFFYNDQGNRASFVIINPGG